MMKNNPQTSESLGTTIVSNVNFTMIKFLSFIKLILYVSFTFCNENHIICNIITQYKFKEFSIF